MSNLQRLQRVVKSWTGVFRGDPTTSLTLDDARTILTHLGMQMSEPAFTKIMNDDKLLYEFLQQYYAAEKEFGKSLLTESFALDPVYEPKVAEENGKMTISILNGKEREILAEILV